MDDIEKKYWTVGQAAKTFDVKVSAIRYWDGVFGIVKKRNAKGRRLITKEEMVTLNRIILLSEFMTLKGIKAVLDGRITISVNGG